MGRQFYPSDLTQGRYLDCGQFFAGDRSADSLAQDLFERLEVRRLFEQSHSRDATIQDVKD
jgi:hypothetical protein